MKAYILRRKCLLNAKIRYDWARCVRLLPSAWCRDSPYFSTDWVGMRLLLSPSKRKSRPAVGRRSGFRQAHSPIMVGCTTVIILHLFLTFIVQRTITLCHVRFVIKLNQFVEIAEHDRFHMFTLLDTHWLPLGTQIIFNADQLHAPWRMKQ